MWYPRLNVVVVTELLSNKTIMVNKILQVFVRVLSKILNWGGGPQEIFGNLGSPRLIFRRNPRGKIMLRIAFFQNILGSLLKLFRGKLECLGGNLTSQKRLN